MLQDNPGCLGFLFKPLFPRGAHPAKLEALPYRLKAGLLTDAELSFYHVLLNALDGQEAVVCPQVSLDAIFKVTADGSTAVSYRNKIDRKRLDFLLCDARTLRPLVGIELDDRSHQQARRQARDTLLDDVFRAVRLPLVRFRASASYSVAEVASRINASWSAVQEPSTPATSLPSNVSGSKPPVCPKCGVPMVLRTARSGVRAGEQFYGCPNYPRCREVRPVDDEE